MEGMTLLRCGAAPGAIAGLAGGLVFGAAMSSVGTLPSVASIVRSDSAAVGLTLHMLIAAVIGAGFGVLVARQQARVGESLFWGLLYGGFWWFLGAQTLRPVLAGEPVAWGLAQAQSLLPSLFGHLFYGAVTAVVFVVLRPDAAPPPRSRIGPVVRGLAAGTVSVALLYAVVGPMGGASPLTQLVPVALLGGACYPLLFTAQEGTGPALVRGTAYGFLWWVLAALTVPALFEGRRLGWSYQDAVSAAEQLPPYLLIGAGTALVFSWLDTLSRSIFVDDIRMFPRMASGGRGFRAACYGAAAGVVGGLVFTGVMISVDALPDVARLAGSTSPTTGLITHLLIAQLIGIMYAALFRGRSFDAVSGIGWGISYGFFWWVLGALTLLPLLTGRDPRWDAAAMAEAFPSLVGHLAYGAALGVVHYWLETRTNPWWAIRSQVEADRVAARREQALGSAPALWGFTTLVALIIPLLVR
ncbi:hypothetical protein [Streptomyces sp. NPDC020681]|uniref:hypothetical protein n=1 Tax=Streptomyces sp. NPDC020681 TaxID=3365083 RepID=UPI003793ECAD